MLPKRDLWPHFCPVPGQHYPERMNAAVELLERNLEAGLEDRPAILQARHPPIRYLQLQDRVQSLAAGLVEMGLEKGDRVLLRLPNCADFVTCWLAILRQGGIAVPTLPLLGRHELSAILADSRPRLAICQDDLLPDLEEAGKESSCILVSTGLEQRAGPTLADLEGPGQSVPPLATSAEDVALLLYTSGSTGRPKGAAHLHRDILAVADCYSKQILKPTPDSIFGGPPSLAFAFGLGGLLIFPLRAGAAMVLGSYLMPPAVASEARHFGITHLFGSPSFFRLLLQSLGDSLKDWLASVKVASSAGESLPGELLREWTKRTGIPLLDGIGTTEMLHIFLSTRIDDAPPDSLGRPVPGYRARLVDSQFNDVAQGEVGQLAVQGPTGCLYWNLPNEQKRYVRQGWNLTGDLCRQDRHGHFQYQCRRDDLIISAGNNIDPLEVENALLQLDGVAECAVIARPDPHLSQIPVAVIVPADAKLEEGQLLRTIQQKLRHQLAPFKIPRKVEIVSQLPRTATGKIRRSALRGRG